MRLGQNRETVALMVSAIREGFAALQSLGVRVTPFNLHVIFRWMPRWFAVRYWQRALQTDVGTLAIAPHANAAPAEMGRVTREILVFLESSPGRFQHSNASWERSSKPLQICNLFKSEWAEKEGETRCSVVEEVGSFEVKARR